MRAISQAFGPLLNDGLTGPVVMLPGAGLRHTGTIHGGGGGGGFGAPRGRSGSGGMGVLGGGGMGIGIGGGHRPAVPAQRQGPPPEASPEALATLLSMGFERSRAVAALQRTNNDVQAAIAQLVS